MVNSSGSIDSQVRLSNEVNRGRANRVWYLEMSTSHASESNRIGVIGAGYVGLTTAVCLASLGHKVTCSDVQSDIVDELNNGRTRLYEPGLEEHLARGLRQGLLRFTTNNRDAFRESDFVFVCVPTPMADGGSADLRYVNSVFDDLVNSRERATVVLRSTVPVGTSSRLGLRLLNTQLNLVFVPEFLREGTAIADFFSPHRVVVGSMSMEASRSTAELFSELNAPMLRVDFESAEMIKYASNVFLAMKVSYINEVARLCERVGGRIEEVSRGIGLDDRIGEKFLSPGPGWGGSCFPKDVDAFMSTSKGAGLDLPLIGSIMESNQAQINHVADRIVQCCKMTKSSKVATLGLSFKSGTNDLRDSPSLRIIERLLGSGIRVSAYDPLVNQNSLGELVDKIEFHNSIAEAVGNVGVVAILTDSSEFKEFNPVSVRTVTEDRIVIDTKRIIDETRWSDAGFRTMKLGTQDFLMQ